MTILVAGKKWTIKRRAIVGHNGRCDFPTRVIYLDPSLSGQELVNIVLHEVGHAADYETEEHRHEVQAAAQTMALAKLGLLTTED